MRRVVYGLIIASLGVGGVGGYFGKCLADKIKTPVNIPVESSRIDRSSLSGIVLYDTYLDNFEMQIKAEEMILKAKNSGYDYFVIINNEGSDRKRMTLYKTNPDRITMNDR